MGIPVTSVEACASDLHITSYNSHRDSTVDRHLSTGSLELWEILLNLWNGRERQWLGNCVPVSLMLNDSAAIVEKWTDTS